MNYYEVLEVSEKSSTEVIISAYKALAKKYHPDISQEASAVEKMKTINLAYEVLSDPAKRAEYDRTLHLRQKTAPENNRNSASSSRNGENDLNNLKQEVKDSKLIMLHIVELEALTKEIRETLPGLLQDKISVLLSKMQTVDMLLKKYSHNETIVNCRENIAWMLRSLAIDLHNERHESEAALRLSSALQTEFADIPSLKNKLAEDVATLKNQVAAKNQVKTQKKSSGAGRLIPIVIILVCIIASIVSNSSASSSTPRPSINSSASASSTSMPSSKPKLIPYSAKNGAFIIEPDYRRKCPLEVKASSDVNYYIYLEYVGKPDYSSESRKLRDSAKKPYQSDLAFYVKAGETAEIKVPIGEYKIYYATGGTFYGKKNLFGESTQRYSINSLFEFYAEKNMYYGDTLRLDKIQNGYFITSVVDANSFPTG